MQPQVVRLFAEDVDNSINGKTCAEYFNSINTAYEAPDLATCENMTKLFRDLDNGASLPFQVHRKGYTIPLDEIKKILDQNGGNMTGIKVYFGIEVKNDGEKSLQLVAIGTYNDSQSPFSDYNIPPIGAKNPDTPIKVVFGNLKPCPKECGSDNVLNADNVK